MKIYPRQIYFPEPRLHMNSQEKYKGLLIALPDDLESCSSLRHKQIRVSSIKQKTDVRVCTVALEPYSHSCLWYQQTCYYAAGYP